MNGTTKVLERRSGDTPTWAVRQLSSVVKWTLLRGTAITSALALILSAGAVFKQWLDQPISIMPFAIDEASKAAGISEAALADRTKADISAIYAASGDLFETRKLGAPTVPLNVLIGGTGLRLQAVVSAFNLSLSSAEVRGRLAPDGDRRLLQWTTVSPGGIAVDEYPVDHGGGSPLTNIDKALSCLALRTVATISPDVAANYLHKQAEAADAPADKPPAHPCIQADDVELYSRVSTDDAAPAATRVNSLVGLSIHFSSSHQLFEELSMASAATHFSAQWLTCDDPTLLPLPWSRLKCRIGAYQLFSDKNRRAAIAAWMQLGAAYSDYANAAPTLGEMYARRARSIDAYRRVIGILKSYAPAYNAMGLQQALLSQPVDARDSYRRSLGAVETAQTRLDMALLEMHGRNESFDDTNVADDDLAAAEADLRRAVELWPDYWDAHAALGYALYLRRKLPEAVDALEAAVQHDAGNRPLRRLLGSAYAGLCRFDAAHASYQQAYDQSVAQSDVDAGWDLAADWGGVLKRFGLEPWAVVQEQRVLASKPEHARARSLLGAALIELAGKNTPLVEQGLIHLKTAVDQDAAKSDPVLDAYLIELNAAGRFGDAIAAYEEWSRVGFVPAPAARSLSDAAIQPVVPHVRLSYARALAQMDRREDALREFEVLAGTGIALDSSDIALVQPHAANAAADDPAIARIQALRVAAISGAAAKAQAACPARQPTTPILLTVSNN